MFVAIGLPIILILLIGFLELRKQLRSRKDTQRFNRALKQYLSEETDSEPRDAAKNRGSSQGHSDGAHDIEQIPGDNSS